MIFTVCLLKIKYADLIYENVRIDDFSKNIKNPESLKLIKVCYMNTNSQQLSLIILTGFDASLLCRMFSFDDLFIILLLFLSGFV